MKKEKTKIVKKRTVVKKKLKEDDIAEKDIRVEDPTELIPETPQNVITGIHQYIGKSYEHSKIIDISQNIDLSFSVVLEDGTTTIVDTEEILLKRINN